MLKWILAFSPNDSFFINQETLCTNSHSFWMGKQVVELAFESVFCGDILGIEEGDVVAPCFFHAAIQRNSQAIAFHIMINAKAFVAFFVLFEDSKRRISRMIVNRNDLNLLIALGEEALKTGA